MSSLPLLLTALLTIATAHGATAPRILVLGDSLSAAYGIDREAGWVAKLAGRMSRQGYPHEVINASISGETSSGGASRLASLLSRHQPDIVLIELGANDGLRGTPVSVLRRNLESLIAATRDSGATPVLIGMRLPPNYGSRYGEAFHSVYVDLAREHDVPLVPFLLEGVALEPDMMQGDGLHPTAAAQERILQNVWPTLSPLLHAGGAALVPAGLSRQCVV